MIAYKFLRSGMVAPFTGLRWPAPAASEPGAWVEAEGPLDVCRTGIHGCAARFLPYWISDELWVAELAEPVQRFGSVLVARRGRLLRQIAAWGPQRLAFAGACAQRTRDRAVASLREAGWRREAEALEGAEGLEDIEHAATRIAAEVSGPPAAAAAYAADAVRYARDDKPQTAAFIAAHAAGFAGPDPASASKAERTRQAAWLAERLDLDRP